MKPKISMIVIAYNGGERLIPTLESHKLQTYPNKELIIGDDASPDGRTQKIIEDWLSENEHFFERVVFIKNQVNAGAVKNFYTAATQATGDVIFQTEQGDLIYGSETIARISDEIEKQRLDGLKDPYIWLGYTRAFSMKNARKTNVYYPYSTKSDLDLIEKKPEVALRNVMYGNFIGGTSLIFSSKYFDKNVYPHPTSIKNLGDYPCLLWNLINKHRIGTIRQFIHWYEFGVGISSVSNNKMQKDCEAVFPWLVTLSDNGGNLSKEMLKRMSDYIDCKNTYQHMLKYPSIFIDKAQRHLVRKFRAVFYGWVLNKNIGRVSSPSFEEDMFPPQYYPHKSDGVGIND